MAEITATGYVTDVNFSTITIKTESLELVYSVPSEKEELGKGLLSVFKLHDEVEIAFSTDNPTNFAVVTKETTKYGNAYFGYVETIDNDLNKVITEVQVTTPMWSLLYEFLNSNNFIHITCKKKV